MSKGGTVKNKKQKSHLCEKSNVTQNFTFKNHLACNIQSIIYEGIHLMYYTQEVLVQPSNSKLIQRNLFSKRGITNVLILFELSF